MKRSWFVVLVVLLTSTSAVAQYDYGIIYDPVLSMRMGTTDLVTAHKLIFSAEDLLLPAKLFNERGVLNKAGGIAYRLAKLVLIDMPTDNLIGVVNHEVFGHGWRLREYGATRLTYQINMPPPYGNGGGSTNWKQGEISYTDDEDIAMRIAGMGANITISDELRNVFLETGMIHYRQAYAYMGGILDETLYILGTDKAEYTSNDAAYYIAAIQDRSNRIDLHTLKQYALLNFVNPAFWLSANSFFNRYLVGGTEEVSFPMLELFGVHYMPSLRLDLTPFGAEVRFTNLVHTGKRIWNVYVCYDGFGGYTSSRVGVDISHLYRTSFLDLGGLVELWDQPEIELGDHAPGVIYNDVWAHRKMAGGRGAMLLLSAKLHPIADTWGLRVDAGLKSAGFTQSEQLDNGPIIRGGLFIRM
ncbi:MAG: hypothetical protein JSS75_12635 [Bacteroidetes bacterium]|nr:hypothetical protein [Bacteroidota bacterium]